MKSDLGRRTDAIRDPHGVLKRPGAESLPRQCEIREERDRRVRELAKVIAARRAEEESGGQRQSR